MFLLRRGCSWKFLIRISGFFYEKQFRKTIAEIRNEFPIIHGDPARKNPRAAKVNDGKKNERGYRVGGVGGPRIMRRASSTFRAPPPDAQLIPALSSSYSALISPIYFRKKFRDSNRCSKEKYVKNHKDLLTKDC